MDRRTVAYHEAGHAVFYQRASLTINGIWMGVDGLTDAEWPNPPAPSQAVDLAAGCVAAWYAEDKARGVKRPHMEFEDFVAYAEFEEQEQAWHLEMGAPENFVPDSVGALEMLRLAADPSENSREALRKPYELMCRIVDRGVEERWPQIEALAQRLELVDYLDGEECLRIIEAAGEEASDG